MTSKNEKLPENLAMYERLRVVPKEAQRTIQAGRLKGFTDINAMWRIKALTEEFGPCGTGWCVNIEKQWLEQGANGEICAFCNLALYYKVGDEWSKPVYGTGGSAFIAKERNGLYTSDECFKMAYTDALSVCAKMIGVAADVYYEKDRTKYDAESPDIPQTSAVPICTSCGAEIKGVIRNGKEVLPVDVAESLGGLCLDCYREAKKHDDVDV